MKRRCATATCGRRGRLLGQTDVLLERPGAAPASAHRAQAALAAAVVALAAGDADRCEEKLAEAFGNRRME